MNRIGTACIVLLLPGFLGCGPSGPSFDRETSVLLILVDALRADHVGCYGYPRDTTPAIDRLCGRGVSFRNAISPSAWTQPSVASLFTALNPLQHGVMRWPQKKDEQLQITIFPEALDTLAERMRDAGFRTGAFVANPYLEGMIGFNQGFEAYMVGDKGAGELQGDFLQWIDSERPEPFFAYLHYMEPHWPYSEGIPFMDRFGRFPTEIDFRTVDWKEYHVQISREPESVPEEEVRQLISLYDGSIRSVDDQIAELLAALDGRGLLDNLIIVVMADHGEEFGEHGRFGHIRFMFDTLLRIPLIFSFPDGWKKGLAVERQVRLVDVMPTILDAAGIAPLEGVLGRSLLPMIGADGNDPSFPVHAFSEFMWSTTYLRHSVRTNEYKLIRTFNRKTPSELLGLDVPPANLQSFLDREEPLGFKLTRGLYHLARDPEERFNLARQPESRAILEELDALLDDWLEENAARFDATEPETLELRGEILERLEGLGYLQ